MSAHRKLQKSEYGKQLLGDSVIKYLRGNKTLSTAFDSMSTDDALVIDVRNDIDANLHYMQKISDLVASTGNNIDRFNFMRSIEKAKKNNLKCVMYREQGLSTVFFFGA